MTAPQAGIEQANLNQLRPLLVETRQVALSSFHLLKAAEFADIRSRHFAAI